MFYAKVRDVKSPERGTEKSAGIDFFVPNDFPKLVVPPNNDLLIPSGIKVAVPDGHMLICADKSGVATSKSACVNAGRKPKTDAFNSNVIIGAKIIDEDYQGEVHIHIINVGNCEITVKPGMKIAQFIIVPINYEPPIEVPESELFNKVSERGDGGFGSTDK